VVTVGADVETVVVGTVGVGVVVPGVVGAGTTGFGVTGFTGAGIGVGSGGKTVCWRPKTRSSRVWAVRSSVGRKSAEASFVPISPAAVTVRISLAAQERAGLPAAWTDAAAEPAGTSARRVAAMKRRRPTRPLIDPDRAGH
jgi:hypothetical protein